MSTETWGDTRSKDGINRRICITRVPAVLKTKNIFERYGLENLEGVTFIRSKKVCFVQFKRPYDHSKALDSGYVWFCGHQLKIRAFREDSPPPKTVSLSNPSSRYTRQQTPPREEPQKTKDQNLSEWGTPLSIENNNTNRYFHSNGANGSTLQNSSPDSLSNSCANSARGIKRKQESTDILAITDRQVSRTNPDLWAEDWPVSMANHHLKKQTYTTVPHSFGQASVSRQSSLPSTASKTQTSLPKFDEQRLVFSNDQNKDGSINLPHPSTTAVAIPNVAGLQSSSNNLDIDREMPPQVELLLRFVLAEKNARNLSLGQIHLLRDYFAREEEMVEKIALAESKRRANEVSDPVEQPIPTTTSTNTTNDNALLEEAAKKLRDELRALQST